MLQVIEKLKGVPQLLAASKRANRTAGINTALEVVNREGEHNLNTLNLCGTYNRIKKVVWYVSMEVINKAQPWCGLGFV